MSWHPYLYEKLALKYMDLVYVLYYGKLFYILLEVPFQLILSIIFIYLFSAFFQGIYLTTSTKSFYLFISEKESKMANLSQKFNTYKLIDIVVRTCFSIQQENCGM